MPYLIIGHTTETTARLWVRGDRDSKTCEVALRYPAGRLVRSVAVVAERDYTATVDFDGLEPGIDYVVHATFSPSASRVCGRLCTIRESPPALPHSFSFVLSSCNLSVVSINNFLARLAATAGTSLAHTSLDLPLPRWTNPRFKWLRRLLRVLLRKTLRLIAWLVDWATGIKQPGSPYLRSPFLKLSAVFDSSVLEIALPPLPEQTGPADIAARRWFLAVGDRVRSSSGATALVASIEADDAEVDSRAQEVARRTGNGEAPPRKARGLVLTQADGAFAEGDALSKPGQTRTLGTISKIRRGRAWFEPPSFFIHAGDQIYYDFPKPDRAPNHEEYRLAYREAWFEDEALCHLLAHWPHYMTLDDHEIADQFALDFKPPDKKDPPKRYRSEAAVAYREYAHALAPQRQNGRPAPAEGPYWYEFDKGMTKFFVLDTRTQRCSNKGLMIDLAQMERLLEWMREHRHALKFVVTSVPFVAEVNEPASEKKLDWFKNQASSAGRSVAGGQAPADSGAPAKERNPEQDKWSAGPFTAQRDQIIEHVAAHGIEHLVFLTGDMHCCYHATMRIGGRKYESITVHELAGGPVNQLQLATIDEFERRSVKRTAGRKDPAVDYEVVLEQFHGDVSAVMHLTVEYRERDQVTAGGRALVPEVQWNVIRTLTDPGPAEWPTEPDGNDRKSGVGGRAESVMAGRICFVKPRTPEGLARWPT